MKTSKKNYGWLPFVITKNKLQVFIAALASIMAIKLFIQYLGTGFENNWVNWIDPFLGIAITIIALSIWFNEQHEEWVKSLPKKLDITYKVEFKEDQEKDQEKEKEWEVFCAIINAPLSHEGDIRSWGQSIGQTILNKRVSIDFAGFQIDPPKIDRKRKVQQYHLTVYLQREIEGVNKGDVMPFNDEGWFETNFKQINKETTLA